MKINWLIDDDFGIWIDNIVCILHELSSVQKIEYMSFSHEL
jgi:hypothetical protein